MNAAQRIDSTDRICHRYRIYWRYSNPCRNRKFFTPPQPSPNSRFGSKKFTNDLGSLYLLASRSPLIIEVPFHIRCAGLLGRQPQSDLFLTQIPNPSRQNLRRTVPLPRRTRRMPNSLQHQIFGPVQNRSFHRRNSISPSFALPHSQLVTFTSHTTPHTPPATNPRPTRPRRLHRRIPISPSFALPHSQLVTFISQPSP